MSIATRFRTFVVAATVAGCSTGVVVKQAPAHPASDAWGIVVLPVQFRFEVPPYESFARAAEDADWLSGHTGLLVYGPGELRVDRPDEDDLARATDVMSAVRMSKARPPEGLYGVRTVVEQRVTRSSAQVFGPDGERRGRRGASKVEVVVRRQLLSLAARGVVAELVAQVHADPFAVDLETDPFPEVTRLSEPMLEALVEVAGLPVRPAPKPKLSLVAAPGPALGYAPRLQHSTLKAWERLDAVEKEARLLALARRLAPKADRVVIRPLRRPQAGLVVLASHESGLEPGDLLLRAGGETLSGRWVLDRHLREGPTRVSVRRAGRELEVLLRD